MPGPLAAHELVGERAERGSQKGPSDVDPEVMPLAGGERGPERAGRVQRRAGQRAEADSGRTNGSGDGQRCGRPHGPGVGGDRALAGGHEFVQLQVDAAEVA